MNILPNEQGLNLVSKGLVQVNTCKQTLKVKKTCNGSMSTHCRSASSPLLVAAVFPPFPKTPTEAQILQPKKNFQKQRDFLLTFRVFSQHDSPPPRWELLMPYCPGMLHLQGTTGLTDSPLYFSNREKFKG